MYYDSEKVKIKLDRLLMYENNFNNFQGITKEDIETISKTIARRRPHAKTRGEWLNNVLQTVLDYRSADRIDSFDKKIIYLIQGMDPNCYIMEKYKAMGNPHSNIRLKEINKLEGKAKAEALKVEEYKLKEYKDDIGLSLGFFDSRLMKYEKAYQKLLQKLRIKNKNLSDILGILTINLSGLSFDNISEERYQEITDNTKKINNYNPKPLTSILSSLSYMTDTLEERIIEMISAIDSDLEIFDIYYDNVRWEDITNEIKVKKKLSINSKKDKELLERIIKLEAAINSQFQKGHVIDSWSK